jgi:prepilin-type N-terminal cleavage/methylation domain-containing protein
MHTQHSNATYGFTLMELLVVMFIIGVLSTIILTGGASQLAKARDSEKISDLAEISIALELYYNSCRQYPSTLATTTTNNGCSGSTNFGSFMRSLPSSASEVSFEYKTNGDALKHSDYVMKITLEKKDKVLNDNVDDADIYTVNCTNADLFYCVRP